LVQDILSNALDYALLKSVKSRQTVQLTALSAIENALEDTLQILQSPLLKVTFCVDLIKLFDALLLQVGKKQEQLEINPQDDDLMDELNGMNVESGGVSANVAAVAATRAKTKVLKTISRQHLVNHVLPVIVSLKHTLETIKSPLQGALMEYLVHLIQAHKTEVEETFNAEPTLKAEIEYDLRIYERQKRLLAEQELQRRGSNHYCVFISYSLLCKQRLSKLQQQEPLAAELHWRDPVVAENL